MSTTESSATWVSVASFPGIGHIIVPTGTDQNNYIVIDGEYSSTEIETIYKYNVDANKWSTIDSFNNQNILRFPSALDVKKQILFLFSFYSVTQIQLNSSNIIN
eukprot:264245_1